MYSEAAITDFRRTNPAETETKNTCCRTKAHTIAFPSEEKAEQKHMHIQQHCLPRKRHMYIHRRHFGSCSAAFLAHS